MNPAAEGKVYPDVRFNVDPARVAAFRSVFDLGPGSGVPPTFVTVAEFAVFPTIFDDPALGLDFAHVLHANQDYAYERPLREGEELVVRARIYSIRQRAGTTFMTVVTDMLDSAGDVVVTARSTMIERGSDA